MMLPESAQSNIIGEIELFIEYGVEQAEKSAAKVLVEKYRNNPVALTALLKFYKVLPEAREEAVVRIAQLDALQGVILLALSTLQHTYIAAVSEGKAHLLGEYGVEELPAEILSYFGYKDMESFDKKVGQIEQIGELENGETVQACPVCQVATGEFHILGCPVEVCPWCEGQLSNCNCRFEKLDVESLDNEEQIESLQDLLEEKGRVPYKVEQKPAYPGTSKGLDRNSTT